LSSDVVIRHEVTLLAEFDMDRAIGRQEYLPVKSYDSSLFAEGKMTSTCEKLISIPIKHNKKRICPIECDIERISCFLEGARSKIDILLKREVFTFCITFDVEKVLPCFD